MNIQELDSYNLADTIKFHDRLNPRLWDSEEHLRPEVKAKLMQVAQDFQEFLGVPDLDVKDITISGSNAAFNYTPGSDIDLHIVVDIPDVAHDEVYRELFNAKKYQYNDEHDIRIRGADVELYAQDSKQPHHSQGIYSLLNDKWLSVPKRTKADVDDVSTRSKFEDLAARIDDAVKSQDAGRMNSLMKKIKTMRQTGLEKQGEFGSDNLAFKLLRNNGYIKRLVDAKQAARDQELSLAELARPQQYVKYGFVDESPDGVDPTTKMFLEEPMDESPDGVNPTTAMFLTETDPETIVDRFIKHTADRLGIKHMPKIFIHSDETWSKQNHSFGMYVPEKHELHVSLGNRHLLDTLRTTAHELCHCAQHEQESLPHNAGVTGSPWENEAHAVAGVIMRDFADAHPELFMTPSLSESIQLEEGIINTAAAAAALTAALAMVPGGAQAQGNDIGYALGTALQIYALSHVTPKMVQNELEKELKTAVRAQRGDPNAQNQSAIYKYQMRQQQQAQQQPQVQAQPQQTQTSPQQTGQYQTAPAQPYAQPSYNAPQQQVPQTAVYRESASGYIPKNKKEAKDPRYAMALTVDIKPGQVGKEANKLALHTGKNGEPALLMKTANLQESLAAEFALFESQDLFEVNMGSKNLRQEAAKTGALAGMEFEMIVPNTEGNDDGDMEPDYDYDERCRSIDDMYNFFYDGDWNDRRSVERARESMREDYIEWIDEKISEEWESQSEQYIADWVRENVDSEEWLNDDVDAEADPEEKFENFVANVHNDPASRYYQDAYDQFRDENQENWDESDWLDEQDLDRMSAIENAYSLNWPHWQQQGGGEASIEDVAQEFENAIGRDVRASGSYHSGRVDRPSPTQQHYVVEPDGSLEADSNNDTGLEFVSPPLPIDELLSDLNKVKKWAGMYGCYTNDSTGLHINISVPNYSRENLDFVKLALLMGDKYVLDAFGRSGNTYAKSALGIIKDAVRNKPEDAARLLDKMKGNLDQLATKAIHSGITSKYTSINTKDGHIEFRSPGGDWLDDNFDKIENTLLRFTVAMSAALNPEMYRQEYLTKLYKMLTENNKDDDTIKYFSDYVAGKIPKAALRSFVKQAQLERKLKRDPTGGERYWWRVDKEGRNARNGASVEVVATNREEAIKKAAAGWHIDNLAAIPRVDAYPLRPFKETETSRVMLGNRPSNPDGSYVIVDTADEATPVYRYMAADGNDALVVLRQWIAANPGTQWNFKFDPNKIMGQPGEPQSTPQETQPRFGLWDFGEGGFINSRGAVGQGGQLIGGDSFDTAREAAQRNGLVSRIDMGEVEIRRIPQQQPAQQGGGLYKIFDTRGTLLAGDEYGNDQTALQRAQYWAQRRGVDVVVKNPQGEEVGRVSASGEITPTAQPHQTTQQGNWGIWIGASGRFAEEPGRSGQLRRFSNREAAEQFLTQTRTENPRMRSDVEVREIEPSTVTTHEPGGDSRPSYTMTRPAEPIPGSTLDLQRQRAQAAQPTQPTDQQQGGIVDVAGEQPAQAPQTLTRPGQAQQTFTGDWKVMIDGEEVYQFGGIGNNQGDANRVGRDWILQQIRQGTLNPANGADIEVLPVMG